VNVHSSLLGNWIAQHNQLLWFRSNGQRLETSQVPLDKSEGVVKRQFSWAVRKHRFVRQ
jgi:hypothetical protein